MLQPFRRKGCDRSQEADSDDSSDDDLAASYERSRRLAAQREEHERLFKTAVHELGADHIRRHALFAQFCEKVEDTFNIAQARREAETSAHAGLFSRDQLISLAQEAEASRDEREAKSMAACEARAQRLFEEQKQRFQQTRDSVRCYCRTRGAVRFAVEAFGNATQYVASISIYASKSVLIEPAARQLGASARLDFASEYRLPVELNHHGEPVLSTGVPSTTSEEAALPAAEDTEGYNSPTNSRTVNTVACSEDEFSGLQQARSGTWTAMLARHAEALDAFDRAYHNLQTRLSSSSRNTESANSIVKDAICLRFQTAEIRRWNEMRALWRRHVRVMEQELWDPDMVRRTWVPRISCVLEVYRAIAHTQASGMLRHACTPCKRAKVRYAESLLARTGPLLNNAESR